MGYTLDDVGFIVPSCMYPEFTQRALVSLRGIYLNLPGVVACDGCKHSVRIACQEEWQSAQDELLAVCERENITVAFNEGRLGTGPTRDRGVALLATPLCLMIDHGIEVKKPGLLEMYLEIMSDPSVFCVGHIPAGKRCFTYFGFHTDQWFTLYDREFIAQNNLTFDPVTIARGSNRIPCTGGALLQYTAVDRGKKLASVNKEVFFEHLSHWTTPRDRGPTASPVAEPVTVPDDFLTWRAGLSP